MKAFNCYGSRCNGCGEHAEFCACDIDSDGNLIRSENNQHNKSADFPDSGEYGYGDYDD